MLCTADERNGNGNVNKDGGQVECNGNEEVDDDGNEGCGKAMAAAKMREMVTAKGVAGNEKAMATVANGDIGGG